MGGRPSQRAFNAGYYARNRKQELFRVRVRQAGTIEFLRELRQVPCTDCRGRFLPHQMDFDHRDPASKEFRITGGRAMLMPEKRLMAEIAKCDVVCANCHRIRTRKAHQTNLSSLVLSSRSRRIDEKRALWRAQARHLDALRAVPCLDCGGRFPACAMDFDHREPAQKLAGVTRMVGRAGIARILMEVAKCDIVCANCHRARTHRRVQTAGRE